MYRICYQGSLEWAKIIYLVGYAIMKLNTEIIKRYLKHILYNRIMLSSILTGFLRGVSVKFHGGCLTLSSQELRNHSILGVVKSAIETFKETIFLAFILERNHLTSNSIKFNGSTFRHIVHELPYGILR